MKKITVSAAEFRADCSSLVSRVEYGNEVVVITRHDKPCAAVIPMSHLTILEAFLKLSAESGYFDCPKCKAPLQGPGKGKCPVCENSLSSDKKENG